MAKKFFYVCAGLLMLALAYHLGASTATAQAPSNSVVASFSYGYGAAAITANGDLYTSWNSIGGPYVHTANIFTGGATPTTTQSFGALKARYR